MVVNLLALFGLAVCTWTDLREKRIYISVIVSCFIMLFAAQVVSGVFSPYVAASGLCMGIVFFFLFFITRGQIGAGDALMFSMVAFAIQGMELAYCILLTFIFLFGMAVLLIALKKADGRTQLPVAPFLLVSYLFIIFNPAGIIK